MMPIMASARGMPTAQPIMRPRFELDPPFESPFPLSPPLALLEPAVGVGVTRMVFSMVTTPAVPVERLSTTELKGVAVVETSSAVAVAEPEFGPSVEGESEDCCADVCDAEFPPPDPPPLVAKPVMVARLGAVDAWF
jgi:hypothetical protein